MVVGVSSNAAAAFCFVFVFFFFNGKFGVCDDCVGVSGGFFVRIVRFEFWNIKRQSLGYICARMVFGVFFCAGGGGVSLRGFLDSTKAFHTSDT